MKIKLKTEHVLCFFEGEMGRSVGIRKRVINNSEYWIRPFVAQFSFRASTQENCSASRARTRRPCDTAKELHLALPV